jgi:type II secretory pathway pseudopilin PulG
MDGAKSQPAAVRRLWTRIRASERGQTLIEVVIAIGIFAIVSGSLVTLLLSSLNTTNFSRQKTLAQQAATTQIEKIRNTAYANVGNCTGTPCTPNGNPPGTIPLTTQLQIVGVWATMTAKIEYVNDPTPLSYQSYANYKRVTVTINRNSDGRQIAQEVTNIAPPVKASQSQGTIVAKVIDIGDNEYLPNVTTNLTNGPSGTETDTTDNSGTVTFAGLTPTTTSKPYYTVGVTPPTGYEVLSDTTPPASSVQFALSPGQVTPPIVVKIYQPVTLYVQLYDNGGTPLSTAATVNVSSSRQTQSFSYTPSMNGQIVVTALNGEDLVPALTYTITVTGVGFVSGSQSTQAGTDPADFNDYPGTLSATYSFTANPISPPVNTVLPGITGTTADGQTLTATQGTWTGTAPISYAYQWQRCTGASCSNISGATGSTYVLTSTDVGKTLQVAVKATNSDGTATATSANTGTVTGTAPSASVNPSISGNPGVGQVLTAAKGTWSGTAPITYAYQWQRCSGTCSNISGATGTTYTLVSADLGKTIQVIVTASNVAGNTPVPSAATATVVQVPANTTAPSFTGTLARGNTLTAGNGTWTPSTGLTYTYQWQDCSSTSTGSCSDISGATGSTYVLVRNDRNQHIRLKVTATNAAGSTTATSSISAGTST